MTRREKQAQMQQVFTFILVAIVIIATILVGGKLISALLPEGCKAEDQRLTRELVDLFETYDTYGTRQTVELPAPCGADALCFLGTETDSDGVEAALSDLSPSLRAQLKILVPDGNENATNIFLVRDGALLDFMTEPKVTVDALSPTSEALCVEAKSGLFRIRVEGQGRTIKLSQPS